MVGAVGAPHAFELVVTGAWDAALALRFEALLAGEGLVVFGAGVLE